MQYKEIKKKIYGFLKIDEAEEDASDINSERFLDKPRPNILKNAVLPPPPTQKPAPIGIIISYRGAQNGECHKHEVGLIGSIPQSLKDNWMGVFRVYPINNLKKENATIYKP